MIAHVPVLLSPQAALLADESVSRSIVFVTPKAFHNKAQGRERRERTLGPNPKCALNPNGVPHNRLR